jgi:hypothetical protein
VEKLKTSFPLSLEELPSLIRSLLPTATSTSDSNDAFEHVFNAHLADSSEFECQQSNEDADAATFSCSSKWTLRTPQSSFVLDKCFEFVVQSPFNTRISPFRLDCVFGHCLLAPK